VNRITIRGLELAYHTFGDPAQFPLLLLHGFFDHGLSFAPMLRALGAPFFCIALDHRGHGDSGWIGDGGYYYFTDYFQDVLVLIDHLGLDRFGLVGHSMGGGIATGVAAMLPEKVKAVVLLEGMGPPYHDANDNLLRLDRWLDALKKPEVNLDRAGRRRARAPMPSLEAAVDRLQRANPRLAPAIARELASTFTEAHEGGVVWKLDPLHRTPSPKAYLQVEIEPLWRAMTMPVLSVHGTESPWLAIDLDHRHACLPNVTVERVQGAGHNLHHEQPEIVAGLVTRWFSA
jgi:pimeloyl-ACP methyl ester carboxylesterase